MSKKSAIIVLSVCLLLIAVLVGGLFLFKGKKIPVLGKVITIPFVEKASAEVINSMMQQVQAVKTGHAEFDISLAAKASSDQSESGDENQSMLGVVPVSNLSLGLTMGYDFRTGENSLDSGGSFDLSGRFSYGGIEYKLALESVYLPNKIYFRATQLPVIPFFDLSSYVNQWYYEDISDLAEDVPYLNQVTDPEEENISEWVETIKGLLDDHSIVKSEERLEDEEIEGVNCYHYKLVIDKEELAKFMLDFYKATPEFENLNLSDNTNDSFSEVAELLEKMDETINEINEQTIEVWVAKRDSMARKMKVGIYYDENVASYDYVDGEISLTFSKINEPISVTIPEEAKALEELEKDFEELTGFITDDYTAEDDVTESIDLSVDTDKDGLTDLEEIIYGTDKDNPDTDGDGFTDGEEIEGGYNPGGTGLLDSDGDGLSDEDEEKYGTDPDNPDTDSDGYTDGEEVLNGFNPNGEGEFINI